MTHKRIGVFGGTFDPIHYGHLAIAADACHALHLEQVLFVVAAQQPLKTAGHGATPQQRLEMVQLACADEPTFAPSDIELHRPPPSYTVDTLRALDKQLAPDEEMWFILGADALLDLPRWREAAHLIALARLAVVARPGTTVDLTALDASLPGVRERAALLEGPRLEISSTLLRARFAKDRPVRYQMPDAVIGYIKEQGLYKT